MTYLFLFSALSCDEQNLTTGNPALVAGGMDFPEGPVWDGEGQLFVSNCYGDWIARINQAQLDTFVTRELAPDTLGQTNGLAMDKNGNLYACDFGRGQIMKISPGKECRIHISGYQGNRFNRPNDLAFDRKGNLYFSDPKSYDPEKRDGVVYTWFRDSNTVRPAATGLAYPNGLAFTSDGRFLYVCESAMSRILRYEVMADGRLNNREILIELPGGDPDGMAIDIEGNIYAAHFGGAAVYIISSEGNILDRIHMPGQKPTNVAFGGYEHRTLYITEAETNTVYRIRTRYPGLPLFGRNLKN